MDVLWDDGYYGNIAKLIESSIDFIEAVEQIEVSKKLSTYI